MSVRRVVTGHNADAKAVFVSDSLVEPQSAPGIAFEFARLWGADSLPPLPDTGTATQYHDYFPPGGGLRFGIFTIPPALEAPLTPEERKNAYVQMEQLFPGLSAHMEVTNPGMHTSDSVDFGYVISGRIWLELDDGSIKELRAGDTYIQNGTRHAWRNRTSEPCSILVVLVGTSRVPSGRSIAQGIREAANKNRGVRPSVEGTSFVKAQAAPDLEC